jgi:glucan 1,3-beta-glucosidase
MGQHQEIDSNDRLEFPGQCSDKTGISAKGFSSEYKEFLAKSFETQTNVYEQAVRLFPLLF